MLYASLTADTAETTPWVNGKATRDALEVVPLNIPRGVPAGEHRWQRACWGVWVELVPSRVTGWSGVTYISLVVISSARCRNNAKSSDSLGRLPSMRSPGVPLSRMDWFCRTKSTYSGWFLGQSGRPNHLRLCTSYPPTMQSMSMTPSSRL